MPDVGEPVNRNEIVLKEEMGYVDKLIGWIGRHPYLSALGLIGLFAGGVAYASSDTVKKTVDKNYEKEKYANVFAPAPAVIADNAIVNESAVPTATVQPRYPYDGPHEFKIIGSSEFKTKTQDALDEINKTSDDFLVNGLKTRDYVNMYWRELQENERENYIVEGKIAFPIGLISASNLIHQARHFEQDHNQTLLKLSKQWERKYPKDDPALFEEYDAVRLQVSWEKARYNRTDEQAVASFNNYMKQYTNDSKYFAKSFPPPDLK